MSRAVIALAVLLALVGPAWPAEWGGIEPGVSSRDDVRARYGAPTRESPIKVEGYDTVEWVYQEEQAPPGFVRMTIEFGILAPSGYKPTVVRLLKIQPRPGIFGRATIVQGWGLPDAVGDEKGLATFFFRAGLFVVFDTEGQDATMMIFSVPQPEGSASPAPPSAPPKQ